MGKLQAIAIINLTYVLYLIEVLPTVQKSIELNTLCEKITITT